MNKSELKTGMVIEIRDGNLYMVLENHEDELFGLNRTKVCHFLLSTHKEDLTHRNSELTIQKVYQRSRFCHNYLDLNADRELLWERVPEKTFSLDGVDYSESTLRSLIKKATGE